MGSEWQEVRLDDVCEGVFDCPHSTPELTSTGPYVVRSQDIRSSVLRLDDAARVSESTYRDRITRAEPRHGDLLYSREGTYFGIAAEIPPNTRLCLGQRMVLIRPSPALVNDRFLLYWLNSPAMAAYTQARRDGSVAERLNLPTIRALPVPLPPLREQHRIAGILGALDDKIELNRRMSQTLESMARALFKSWFVDFDPVRAKAAGHDDHLPEQFAKQFPDSLSGSEIGAVPTGWRVRQFGAVVEQLRDQENPISSPDTQFHHYSIPAFDDGQNAVVEHGESIKSLKSRVPPGTVLLSKLNPEIERVWLVDVESHERAVCSTEFLVLAPLAPFTRSFVYCLTRSPQFRGQIDALVTGTSNSHQRAQAGSILGLTVVVPPPRTVEAFEFRCLKPVV